MTTGGLHRRARCLIWNHPKLWLEGTSANVRCRVSLRRIWADLKKLRKSFAKSLDTQWHWLFILTFVPALRARIPKLQGVKRAKRNASKTPRPEG